MSMHTPGKPYDRLGPFVLFRKLDSDTLGDTWRAGMLEPPAMGPVLAVRKLTGNREAWAASFPSAKLFAEKIGGTTIAKAQKFDFFDGHPVIAWEYAGGRSLAHVAASAASAHNPIPTDQALAITEKIVSALEAVNSVKQEGKRLVHGALIPQFVWISDDGDVRVTGQLLGKGLLASLSDFGISKETGPYVAPELRAGAEATKQSDIYAAGAILFLAITGQAPPDAKSGRVVDAIHAAKLAQGDQPVPDDIKAIFLKTLAPDPAARFDGPSELHKALSELLSKGQYAPTTFNLAFYLHNLLRSEMEAEQKEQERESKIDVKGYLEDLARPASPTAPQPPLKPLPPPAPMFGTATFEQPKQGGSKMPLVLGGVALVAIAAVGAWFVLGKKSAPPVQTAAAAPAPVTQTVPVAPEPAAPVVTALPGQEAAAPTGTDAEAHKKAMEDEINRRVAAEMAKVQSEYNRELAKQQDAATRTTGTQPAAATASAPVPATTTQPAQRQTAAVVPPPPATATQPAAQTPATTTQAPAAATTAEQPPPAAAQQQPAAPPAVETGDFVASTELDKSPILRKRAEPVYPPLAARQRVSGAVILGLLINETGRVQDARILSVEPKGLGFEDSAVAAAKKFVYDPGIKDGKKVKTLIPVPFVFGK